MFNFYEIQRTDLARKNIGRVFLFIDIRVPRVKTTTSVV